MSDPTRLLPSAKGLERALLRSTIDPGPTNTQCDAVWSALEARLEIAASITQTGGGVATAPPATTLRAAATSSAWMTVRAAALFASTTALVGILSWGALHPSRRPPPAPLPPPLAVATPSAPPPAVTDVPAPSAAPSVEAPARARRIAPGAPPPRPPRVERSSLQEEALLLREARESWRGGDCARALKRLDEARARFSSGMLAQEREALAIQALGCMDRRDEAAARAAAFLREYPASPHAAAVEELLR